MLAGCYRSSLALAKQYSLKTIAFPAISTGVYDFPVERAARIAVTEVRRFLEGDASLDQVVLVGFSDPAYQCYLSVVTELAGDS